MSPRRWFGAAALALGGLAAVAATPAPAFAQGSIVARVGGNLAARVGDTLTVPLTVDMRGAPGVRLGSYTVRIQFNPGVLYNLGGSNGTFASPTVNSDSASQGVLRLTAIQPSGADSVITLFVGHFLVQLDTGASDITASFSQMSTIAPTFADLLPILSVVNGTFCHAAGRWGDVDGDGQANSRDALIALSEVVGIALDTARLDTLYTDSAGVHTHLTVLMRPGLADVDGDGQVTSRDALIIVSYAVGLPVPGLRIGLPAAGACSSGFGITLAIAPDTLELQTGQTAEVVISGRDSTGQPIALSGATWTSANTAVAGALAPGIGGQGFRILARDSGTSVVTVRLGAGYRASMLVKVLAHRTQWFVDAAHAQSALQTGSSVFPYGVIGDAFNWARDADTINVAPGTYEEAVSSSLSVLLRGDPVNLPVLDPRGAYSYSPYTPALNVGSRVAPMVIENLWVLHGAVDVYSHDFFAHNLHIEGGDSINTPLYFQSALGIPPGAPPAGVRLAGASFSDTGNVVLDSVTVHNFGNVYSGIGIDITQADSAIIRHSSVTRDSTIFPVCGGYGQTGISVNAAAYAEVTNTTVRNAACVGMSLFAAAGSVRVSGNVVDRSSSLGIGASAETVASDHNLVTRIISASTAYKTAGIAVLPQTAVRSLTSVGDVIRGVGDGGFVVAGVLSARIDSLTVDTAGLDGTYTATGVDFFGGHLTLTNSRIRHVRGAFQSGVGALAWTPNTTPSVLESRHNVYEDLGAQGIYASSWAEGGPCGGGGCAPAVQRGAMDGGYRGPDSLISVGDSIRYTDGPGIAAEYTGTVIVDSALIDTTQSDGVNGYYTSALRLTRSAIHGVSNHGVQMTYGDSLTVTASAIAGAYTGIYANGITQAARIVGTAIDSSVSHGIDIEVSQSGVSVFVDSSKVTRSPEDGLFLYCSYCVDSATVTRSTFTGNSIGVDVSGYLGGFAVAAHRNNFFGNARGGASNESPAFAAMNADTNWWGSALGPQCDSILGCDPASTGDSVLTQNITFAGFLTAPATDVFAAPRFLHPLARRAAPIRPAVAASLPVRPVSVPRPLTLVRPEARARPALVTWRRGRVPQTAPPPSQP